MFSDLSFSDREKFRYFGFLDKPVVMNTDNELPLGSYSHVISSRRTL